MEFTPVFEKINYDTAKGKIKEQIRAVSKTEVAVGAVSSILSVSSMAFSSDAEVSSGKISYGGKVLFYISYIDAYGEVKKVECGNEFSGVIKDPSVLDGDRAFITVSVDKTEVDLAGSFMTVTAYLTVCADLTSQLQVSALSGGENLVVDTGDIEVAKSLGCKYGSYPVEDEFELSYPVSEVLSYSAVAVVTATQCGVGRIIVDGEVLLSLIVLQKNDKRDIIRENRSLPFRAEIEFDGATPIMQAVARVKEKAVKLDLAVDGETGRSTVLVKVNLRFEGQAFSLESLTVAKDVFSVDKELEVELCDFCSRRQSEQRTLNCAVKGRATVDQLPIGAGVYALTNERVEITEQIIQETGVKFTGVLTATVFLRDGDYKPFSKKLEIPVEYFFDCALGCACEIDSTVKASGARAKIVSATEIEMEADLNFTVYPSEKCSFKVVKGVKAVGEKKKPTSAISVYIPTEGEDLWSLSKRLGVCPESLMETNKELCFPLTGNERIVIYRQK